MKIKPSIYVALLEFEQLKIPFENVIHSIVVNEKHTELYNFLYNSQHSFEISLGIIKQFLKQPNKYEPDLNCQYVIKNKNELYLNKKRNNSYELTWTSDIKKAQIYDKENYALKKIEYDDILIIDLGKELKNKNILKNKKIS